LTGQAHTICPVGHRVSWLEELLDSPHSTLHLQHQDYLNHRSQIVTPPCGQVRAFI
ncbi:hypothetical protein KUCAC02_007027, partial [Chaenocephalus aceratus]